jgi:hypothetical protein
MEGYLSDITKKLGDIADELSLSRDSLDELRDSLNKTLGKVVSLDEDSVAYFNLADGYRFLTTGKNLFEDWGGGLYLLRAWSVQRLGTSSVFEFCSYGPTSTTEMHYVGFVIINMSHVSYMKRASAQGKETWKPILDGWDTKSKGKAKSYGKKKEGAPQQQDDEGDEITLGDDR